MLIPCGPFSDGTAHRLIEREVAHSFTRRIDGREFTFCVHPDVSRPNFWTLSHYETGFKVANLIDDDDPARDGERLLEDIIGRRGEIAIRCAILQSWNDWKVNGCMPCRGTGWATVGGPCTTCRGSGKSREPKP